VAVLLLFYSQAVCRLFKEPGVYAGEQTFAAFADAMSPSGAASRALRHPTQQDRYMNMFKTAGIVLIIAGILAVAYGGFSYTKDTTAVKLGPIELSVQERERVNIPLWAGIGAIVLGAGLLAASGRTR